MHFKPKIVLCLLAILLFSVSTSYAALEIKRGPIYGLLKKALPFKNLEFAGYLKNETALRLAHGLDEFMKEANIAQLETEYKFNDHVQFFSILRWFYDSVYQLEDRYKDDPKWESKTNKKLKYPEKLQWLRECYLDILTDRLDLRLGKQQVVWGTADGIRILDIVNPLDYREWTLKDYIDTRIPLWMINAEGKILMNGQLQFLLIPDYEPNYYAPAGAPFTLRTVQLGADQVKALAAIGQTTATIDQKPSRQLEHSKIGLRWRNIIEGHAFEYTLNYLNTYDFASSAYSVYNRVGTPNLQLTRRAEHINVFGGTFSKTITEGMIIPGLAKGWTLRGELAYIRGGAMNYGVWGAKNPILGTDNSISGTIDVDQCNYVLGFDKSFFTNWQFSFQFIQMWALQKEKPLDFNKNTMTLLNGATRGPLDKVETTLTVMLATDFLHERLKPQVLVLYGDDNDWRISPKVSYEISDQWLATLGLHIFEGKEYYLNGQFDKNDEIFAELKYTF